MKSKAFFVKRLIELDPTLDPEELIKMRVLSLLELIKIKKNPPPVEVPEPELEPEAEDLMTSILGCRS